MLRIGQIEITAQDNKYTDGNVAGGIPATRLRAAALNAIQEELAGIVEAAGQALDPADFGQVLKALKHLFAEKTESLGALAALTGAANKLPYFTGANAAALTDLTSVGRDILAAATKDAVLTYLGLSETIDLAKNALPKTGTAAAAKKLETARKINGVGFDGTADITIPTFGAGNWTDVTASRTTGTLYTNTTGSALIVSVYTEATTVSQVAGITGFVNSTPIYISAVGGGSGLVTKQLTCLLIVPPGATYSISTSNVNVLKWSELR